MSPLTFALLPVLVCVTTALFDADFCAKNMGPYVPPSPDDPKMPQFFDNFYVFTESKTMGQNRVDYTEQYYSQQSQLAYANLMSPSTPAQIWVDANYDEVSVAPVLPNGVACTDVLLEDSIFFSLFHATPANGHFSLNTPAAVFGWEKSLLKNITYKGKSSVRGITTDKWWTCEWLAYNDTTLFTEWQIVDPSKFLLPAVSKNNSNNAPILPVRSTITTQDKSDPTNQIVLTTMIDFTHFEKIQPNDRHFRLPPDMICANAPSTQIPLPQMPNYFRFRGEQITLEGYKSSNPDPPLLTYTIEEYIHNQALFIQDFVDPPDPNTGSDKSYLRIVSDFNTGLVFSLNLNSGQCTINPIDASNIGAFALAGGFVKMRDASQFFDLDSSNYTYMGLNRVEGRGIECNVWSAYFNTYSPDHAMNTLYTWYFATPDWMVQQGYQNPYDMPVLLELTSVDRQIKFHFFEYSTQQTTRIPDLSTCFTPSSTMNIQLRISASFYQVYLANPAGFRNAFTQALTGFTSLKSYLRIGDLDFLPADNNEILVQFKLLDKPAISGDVQNPLPQSPNSQIFAELTNKANTGAFYFDVPNALGQPGKVTVTVKQNSVVIITVPQTNSGSSRALSRSDTSAIHIALNTQNKGSSGYSSGSMAGIGIGMLVLGVVLGFLGIFLFKKFRRVGVDSVMSMQQLENEAES
ncbi:uncharacterized protein LOC131928125 [Physella acuta]|uniref:uncharacterized protein LOC131928125 n=1 Tax=Physella acuta TaxID=109671 RepID=UPI0027DD5FB5|nr:uncharacterized protein LOC131928125 [Physella acuta]